MADDVVVTLEQPQYNVTLPVGVAPPISLSQLTDVTTTGSQNGYVLQQVAPNDYRMAVVPRLPTALNDLTNVDTSSGQTGQVITQLSDGSYAPQAIPSPSVAFNDLTDVNTSGSLENVLYGLTRASDDIYRLTQVPDDRFIRFFADLEDVDAGDTTVGYVPTRIANGDLRMMPQQGGGGGNFDPTLDYTFTGQNIFDLQTNSRTFSIGSSNIFNNSIIFGYDNPSLGGRRGFAAGFANDDSSVTLQWTFAVDPNSNQVISALTTHNGTFIELNGDGDEVDIGSAGVKAKLGSTPSDDDDIVDVQWVRGIDGFSVADGNEFNIGDRGTPPNLGMILANNSTDFPNERRIQLVTQSPNTNRGVGVTVSSTDAQEILSINGTNGNYITCFNDGTDRSVGLGGPGIETVVNGDFFGFLETDGGRFAVGDNRNFDNAGVIFSLQNDLNDAERLKAILIKTAAFDGQGSIEVEVSAAQGDNSTFIVRSQTGDLINYRNDDGVETFSIGSSGIPLTILSSQVLMPNIPSGTSRPPSVPEGGWWLDTSAGDGNGVLKQRLAVADDFPVPTPNPVSGDPVRWNRKVNWILSGQDAPQPPITADDRELLLNVFVQGGSGAYFNDQRMIIGQTAPRTLPSASRLGFYFQVIDPVDSPNARLLVGWSEEFDVSQPLSFDPQSQGIYCFVDLDDSSFQGSGLITSDPNPRADFVVDQNLASDPPDIVNELCIVLSKVAGTSTTVELYVNGTLQNTITRTEDMDIRQVSAIQVYQTAAELEFSTGVRIVETPQNPISGVTQFSNYP